MSFLTWLTLPFPLPFALPRCHQDSGGGSAREVDSMLPDRSDPAKVKGTTKKVLMISEACPKCLSQWGSKGLQGSCKHKTDKCNYEKVDGIKERDAISPHANASPKFSQK